MKISAQNQIPGKVVSITKGSVMSEVTMDIGGGHQIKSLIGTSSVSRLKLKKGSPIVAIIKATEVVVAVTEAPDAVSRQPS
jgi:molybdopterin-binding protein